jgi:LysR family transcriptional activator of nhaA
LALLPEVVVQDELRSGVLVAVSSSEDIQERFYAITRANRHRMILLDRLLSTTTHQIIDQLHISPA